MRSLRLVALLAVAALVVSALPAVALPAVALTPRPLVTTLHGRWIGNGIAYGMHRDGQRPGGTQPTRAQVREDLHLIAAHWNLIRIYGARDAAEDVMAIIRADHLPIRVVLGAWIAPTERRDSTGRVVETFEAARAANAAEMAAAVDLARRYPEVVSAICVGNETQIFWSDHRVPEDSLIADLRWVRSRTRVPVTTADDFNFWNKPEAHAVADEVDFIMLHAHPMWNGRQLEAAPAWTESVVTAIRGMHPRRTVMLAETGWATSVGRTGDQALYIKGHPGEAEQATFHAAITAWAQRTRTPLLFFEAFDENWKGGDDPIEVEKHWGVFHADRTPKQVLAGGR